jgi:hypothetical protein
MPTASGPPLGPTLVITALVTVVTGWMMVRGSLNGDIHWAELTAMPLLFLAMVRHARRRVAALRWL